jgi:uncharacterized membrane protein YkvA (DUF1232 family)
MVLASMPVTPKPRPAPADRPVLSDADFEQHLISHAAAVAPADVTALVARGTVVRRRLHGERHLHPELARRGNVALDLLSDHARGACPQIPYHTISLLASALLYYLAPVDVIPDFIPRIGTADDALVLDIAWRLAAPGIERYTDWKDLAAADAAPARRSRTTPSAAAPGRRRTRRAAKTRTAPRRR